MLSLKLVRSLVLGETINASLLQHNHGTLVNHDDDNDDDDYGNDGDDAHDLQPPHHTRRRKNGRKRRSKSTTSTTTTSTAPLLLFLPTRELVKDTYRLATIARDMGMDLHPDPSLSHIIFSWPSSLPSPSSSSPSIPSLFSSSSSSSSSSWSSSENSVPLPFPSLATASSAHLRHFALLSKGLFKLVLCKLINKNGEVLENNSNWDCSSLALFSRVTSERIDTMDDFVRALAGMGWTLFKTKNNPSMASGYLGSGRPLSVYLFRKIDCNRVQGRSGGRIRELRLPNLDFKNAPLRILQYILLMTNDIFYLA